jgi:hypothetical protein
MLNKEVQLKSDLQSTVKKMNQKCYFIVKSNKNKKFNISE